MALSAFVLALRWFPHKAGPGIQILVRRSIVQQQHWKCSGRCWSYSITRTVHAAKKLPKHQIQDVSHADKEDVKRHACVESCNTEILQNASIEKYRNIYTFRYIVFAKVVSRLKIYQTLFTVTSIPPGVYLHKMGLIATSELASIFGIATLATVMLYVMSTFFCRIAGIISTSEKEDMLRISHLTFWGKRKNVEFTVSDIIPLSDLSYNANDLFVEIRFFEQPQVKFYWFHRHGKNTDPEALKRIFGKL